MQQRAYHSLYNLVRKEFRMAYRDKTILLLASLIWLFVVASSILSAFQYQQDTSRKAASSVHFRKQWEAQQHGLHDAAHYGTYLFKPLNLLSAFDPGLNNYSGTTYRVEAHIQHEMEDSNAENSNALMRFGQFSLSLILQLFIPLLVLFMTASALTAEKESGTLKMLLAQGIKPVILTWGKVFANFLMILVIVLPVFAGLAIVLLFSAEATLFLPRLLLILLSYSLYYLLVAIAGVWISSLSKSSKTATILALVIWLLGSILIPKMATQLADQQYPLSPRNTFNDKVREGYLKGINGKDPYYDRGERYLKNLLKKYGVDSIHKLPVDADALVMQYNEDYQFMVFNHYYQQIEQTFGQQQAFLSNAGFADPFISIKRISMAMAGTDFYHHNDFFLQARTYRNALIRKLNLETANKSAEARAHFHPGPGYFKKFTDFHYQMPSLTMLWTIQWKAFTSLLAWVLVLSLLLHFNTKRLLS